MKTQDQFTASWKIAATLAIAVALLSACIPSVNPYYTDKQVFFEPRLVGEWLPQEDSKDAESWKFESAEGKAYKLTVTEEEGRQGEFTAHLFKLKQELFLDLIPSECKYATNEAGLVAAAMIPGHLLARVTQVAPELKLAFFDWRWLEQHLKANPKALAHRAAGETIVLTASTRDLQRFVLKHLGEDGLFDSPSVMTRKTGGPTGP
ncbi:MAG: hypothetical protein KIS67_05420 [Verrucomicrobiae bacterium]|nr:hypothetical protein [Verrucomicrobiae bacterium]